MRFLLPVVLFALLQLTQGRPNPSIGVSKPSDINCPTEFTLCTG